MLVMTRPKTRSIGRSQGLTDTSVVWSEGSPTSKKRIIVMVAMPDPYKVLTQDDTVASHQPWVAVEDGSITRKTMAEQLIGVNKI